MGNEPEMSLCPKCSGRARCCNCPAKKRGATVADKMKCAGFACPECPPAKPKKRTP